jgi:undecaprenyl-diphosphatase
MSRPDRLRSLRRWAPHIGAALLLAAMFAWDRPVYDAIHGVRSPFLDQLTNRISNLRGATFPILVGIALVIWGALRSRTKVWRAGTALLITVVLAGAMVLVLKPTFARRGPGHEPPPKPGATWIDARYGRFPSSHAAVLFGAATAVATFLPATAVVGYGTALLVCYERLYRATHFPSDIVAGAWIGILVARFVVGWLARRESWRNDMASFWLPGRWRPRAGHPARDEAGEAREMKAADP